MLQPRRKPRLAATPNGTVMALADNGDLGADLADAIAAAGGDDLCSLTPEQLMRCIEYERIGEGLRAEAGMMVRPFVLILHLHAETFQGNKRLSRWLTFSRTSVGDAVYWNIGLIHGRYEAVSFALLREADNLLGIIRDLAGKALEVTDSPINAPTEEEMTAARKA
jgi:hypothetical protein